MPVKDMTLLQKGQTGLKVRLLTSGRDSQILQKSDFFQQSQIFFQDTVKEASVKDEWGITHDLLTLSAEDDINVMIDLGAEKTICI
ncbi:MAG: element excision factor XisH family protein [Chloroflexota bacterium]